MESQRLLSAAALIACLSADIANADDAAPVDAPSAAAQQDESREIRGLYVRGGLGFGGIGNNVIGERENADGELPEGTVTGMGMVSEITLGGALGTDWVLGVGMWNAVVFTTDYTQIQGDEIPEGLRQPTSMTLAGGLANWHFAPRLGLYAQGGLGLAVLSSEGLDGNGLDGSTWALGPGLTLGIGADFWIEERWALGVIARMSAGASAERERDQWYVHGLVAPALLMTVAYNE
jgi:opacity protein-like surface antigen